MNKYKYHIAQELHKPQMDIVHLQMLSIVRFAFVKNCVDDFATPCWVFMCNFTALELLGDEAGKFRLLIILSTIRINTKCSLLAAILNS
jgi:hypothetical protein